MYFARLRVALPVALSVAAIVFLLVRFVIPDASSTAQLAVMVVGQLCVLAVAWELQKRRGLR
jgi:hypothetical protein